MWNIFSGAEINNRSFDKVIENEEVINSKEKQGIQY